jgi:hypothetical protein
VSLELGRVGRLDVWGRIDVESGAWGGHSNRCSIEACVCRLEIRTETRSMGKETRGRGANGYNLPCFRPLLHASREGYLPNTLFFQHLLANLGSSAPSL